MVGIVQVLPAAARPAEPVVECVDDGALVSVRGSFNNTHPITLAGHALSHAMQRAGVDPVKNASSLWG
jgi:hypothetical protein